MNHTTHNLCSLPAAQRAAINHHKQECFRRWEKVVGGTSTSRRAAAQAKKAAPPIPTPRAGDKKPAGASRGQQKVFNKKPMPPELMAKINQSAHKTLEGYRHFDKTIVEIWGWFNKQPQAWRDCHKENFKLRINQIKSASDIKPVTKKPDSSGSLWRNSNVD